MAYYLLDQCSRCDIHRDPHDLYSKHSTEIAKVDLLSWAFKRRFADLDFVMDTGTSDCKPCIGLILSFVKERYTELILYKGILSMRLSSVCWSFQRKFLIDRNRVVFRILIHIWLIFGVSHMISNMRQLIVPWLIHVGFDNKMCWTYCTQETYHVCWFAGNSNYQEVNVSEWLGLCT